MSRPDVPPTAHVEHSTAAPSDAARRQEVREEAMALRAESRRARQQSAEIRAERNAILDAVALLAGGPGRSAMRERRRTAGRASAPTVGAGGSASVGGESKNGRGWGPPSPPWKQISCSNAQSSSSSGS